jgi:hypothetical protein
MSRDAQREASVRRALRLALAPALLSAAACRAGGAPDAAAELGEMRGRELALGARTIAHEERFSLYSPFSTVGTIGYRNLVDEEVRRTLALFELEPEEAIPIRLVPQPGMRGRIEGVEGEIRLVPAGPHPLHGLAGWNSSGVVEVFVEPPAYLTRADGTRIEGQYVAESYRGVLRHELAHACAVLAGLLRGEPWYDEGLAHFVEFSEADGARLHVERRSPDEPRVDHLPRDERRLELALRLGEDTLGIARGAAQPDVEGRRLALSFFAFLYSRRAEAGFVARARAIGGMSREQLLAHEAAWQASLDGVEEGGEDGGG